MKYRHFIKRIKLEFVGEAAVVNAALKKSENDIIAIIGVLI